MQGPPVLPGSEGLAMLLPKLLKPRHVKLALLAVRCLQSLSSVSLDGFIGGAALKRIQTKIILSIDMAESAYNLPDHNFGF